MLMICLCHAVVKKSSMSQSIATLDELTEQLKTNGFQISRSGVYLQLLP